MIFIILNFILFYIFQVQSLENISIKFNGIKSKKKKKTKLTKRESDGCVKFAVQFPGLHHQLLR